MSNLSARFSEGRAEKAQQLHHVDRSIRQLKFDIKSLREKNGDAVNHRLVGDKFVDKAVDNLVLHV